MKVHEKPEFDPKAAVVIIGGGVIGLSIARALARRGVREIVVIDQSDFGREASWAAGGILAPQVEADAADDFFRLACKSRDLYPQFAAELKTETGIDVELDTAGTLYVGFSDQDETEFRERFEWQRSEGFTVEWLDGNEARRLEPCLSDKVRCALRFPKDYQVDNRKLVQALLIANERLGVRLLSGCEARGLKIENDKVVGVDTSQGLIETNVVVVAAGAWSSRIDSSKQLI